MDRRTGYILPMEDVEKLVEEEREFYQEMKLPPTEKQLKRNPARVGRNEACPCGSGKKFKKCCLWIPVDPRPR